MKTSSIKLTVRYCASIVILLAVANRLSATVVNFEDIPPTFLSGTSVVSQGFRITHSGSFAFLTDNTGQGATDFSGNGTNRLVAFNQSTITLQDNLGNNFGISSFEGGESWVNQPHFWAAQIQAVGYLFGGGTTTQTFNLDLFKDPTQGMQTFVFNGSFTNLTSVDFYGIGGNPEFSLDNFSVNGSNSVPDTSATVALLGASFLGLAALRRRFAA